MSTNPSLSTSQCTKFRGRHFEKNVKEMENEKKMWGDILN